MMEKLLASKESHAAKLRIKKSATSPRLNFEQTNPPKKSSGGDGWLSPAAQPWILNEQLILSLMGQRGKQRRRIEQNRRRMMRQCRPQSGIYSPLKDLWLIEILPTWKPASLCLITAFNGFERTPLLSFFSPDWNWGSMAPSPLRRYHHHGRHHLIWRTIPGSPYRLPPENSMKMDPWTPAGTQYSHPLRYPDIFSSFSKSIGVRFFTCALSRLSEKQGAFVQQQ